MSQPSFQNQSFIRKLDRPDLPQMLVIERAVYEDPWSEDLLEQSLTAPLTYVLGIFREENLMGYAIFQVIYTEAHLLNLAISKSHQKQGFATYFLDHLMKEACKKGALRMFLEVRPSNVVAIHLYEKMKFEKLSVRESYYSNGEDAIVMAVDLL